MASKQTKPSEFTSAISTADIKTYFKCLQSIDIQLFKDESFTARDVNISGNFLLWSNNSKNIYHFSKDWPN